MAGTSGARRFTESDKAAGLTALAANDGNIKRTARDLSINTATLRRWRDQAARGNGPSHELVQGAASDFIANATRIRDKALEKLEHAIDMDRVNPTQLNNIMGTLDDKITRVKALPPSKGGDSNPALMDRDTMRELMRGAVQGAIEAAKDRQDIIEAEIVQELPAPDTTSTKLRAVG